jgi:calreticulin
MTDGWTGRWVESKHQSDYGKFKLTAGNFYGDAEKDKGLLHLMMHNQHCFVGF